MEHLYTLLGAIVTGILTPIIVGWWNQHQRERKAHLAEEAEERDWEREYRRLDDHCDNVNRAFRFLFEEWRGGSDLKGSMANLDAVISGRPKIAKVK